MAGYLLFRGGMTQREAADPAIPVASERRGFYKRSIGWLFSPTNFHFKLLAGTAVGIIVITLLAGIFLFVTVRNHKQAAVRSHILDVIRMGGVIESDLAAIESIHRGYLLTGDNSYLKAFESRRDLVK